MSTCRSKLLRVGMVTPSDDLCSPAMAVNPRNNSGSDYQEVKVRLFCSISKQHGLANLKKDFSFKHFIVG